MQSSSHHLLLFFISLNILFFPSMFKSDPAPSKFSNCATLPYRCGDKTFNISYPFQIDERPNYCGNPDYHISCTNANTTLAITISNQEYQITSIDYDNNLINIVNKDCASATGCPQPQTYANATLNTILFRFSQRDRHLTVYINCQTSSSTIPAIVNYACFDFSGQSYYRLDNGTFDDLIGKCSNIIDVPMGQETADNLISGKIQFKQALQQGFWTGGLDWCGNCMNSRGYCGYNVTDVGQHLCFCPEILQALVVLLTKRS